MWAGASVPGVAGLRSLASIGALGIGVAVPLVTAWYFAFPPSMPQLPAALVATGLYLPLHLRHVAYGLRGQRPRWLPWTLLGMAAVIVGFSPLLGARWLYAYSALAASVLVTTRPRTSFPLLALILAAVAVWAGHVAADVGNAQYVYLPAAVLDRAMMVFVPVWLVGALRRMQAARQALADEAVATQRRQVDNELRRTVGIELEEIVASAERALAAMSRSGAVAEDELQPLVEGSRHALAEARRVVARYKPVSSGSELEKAASLLRAAGIEVAIELPPSGLPPALDDSFRRSLRETVAELLAKQPAGPVVLRIARDGSAFTLSVDAESSREHLA